MILTNELRDSALKWIRHDLAEELKLEAALITPRANVWRRAGRLVTHAETITSVIIGEEMDHVAELIIRTWADVQLIEESLITEMNDALDAAEQDVLDDNPEINIDSVWSDLVAMIAQNYPRDAITAEWIRTKLG